MSHADLEPRPPTDYDRQYPAHRPDRSTPWWIAAMVAMLAIVAAAVVLMNRDETSQQAAYNQGVSQGVSQASANDATQRAESAAAQANSAADAANASAINAQNHAVLRNQQNEDNPALQPHAPAGVNSAAPPGVISNSSSPPSTR
ncbi:MAG TPA: hypothetical protein VHY32_04010 [Caulobacteraceae bacterium]|jgi:hypothetical protein|nr:hypothetical protein [Caulobacteraceae bacterium]